MGKLRFTLTYLLFWFAIIFSCLLAENFSLFASDHMGGMEMESLYLLSFFVILLLVFYYILERKHNGIKLDTVLLCAIATFGLVSILTVCFQGTRTFTDGIDGAVGTISFSPEVKFQYVLQIIIWCAVLYGTLYAITRYSISRKWLKWLALVYIVGLAGCAIVDIFLESNKIIGVFAGNYQGDITFIIYNSNVWAHLLLIGIFSCIVLCLKRFKPYYYAAMAFFFFMIIFTSCTTAIFVSITVMVAYTVFEIIAVFYKNRKKLVTYLAVYIGGLIVFSAVFALMVIVNVDIFANFWDFVFKEILNKDYSTLTSRTGIWASVFGLLSKNPIDFIFGLGYKTGNAIFTEYFMTYRDTGFAIRSTHNGFMEIFLRHGLLGVLAYLALLSTFVFGLVRLIKIKQYRVAYLYSLCFFGILVHGMAESTTFFTPNIGGMYATLIFFLPVAKETKYNRLKLFNKDLQEREIPTNKLSNSEICYCLVSLLAGLVLAVASLFLCMGNTFSTPELVIYICLLSVLVLALFISPALLGAHKKAYWSALFRPIANKIVMIVVTIVLAVISAIILQTFFAFDIFSRIMFSLSVFAIFSLGSLLAYGIKACPVVDEMNNRFTRLLQKVSSEVPYE